MISWLLFSGCPAGQEKVGGVCRSCPPDEYNPTPGGTCFACSTPSETTAGLSGQTECSKCKWKILPAASLSLHVLRLWSTCAVCQKIHQWIAPFLFLFSVCAAGYGGAGSPGAGCTACVAGEFKAAAGNAVCAHCPPGQISAAAGATSCDNCPAEQYETTGGATSCSACETGSTTNGATGQQACG